MSSPLLAALSQALLVSREAKRKQTNLLPNVCYKNKCLTLDKCVCQSPRVYENERIRSNRSPNRIDRILGSDTITVHAPITFLLILLLPLLLIFLNLLFTVVQMVMAAVTEGSSWVNKVMC